jgi:hypothetical protein
VTGIGRKRKSHPVVDVEQGHKRDMAAHEEQTIGIVEA